MTRYSTLLAGGLLGLTGVLGGDIIGKVALKGTPPKEIEIVFDPSCSAARKEAAGSTRFYVVNELGGLADVFVSLKNVEGDFPIPDEALVLDQVGCEYMPYILAGRAGQKIVVKNSDPVFHNVHPTPRVKGNPESNNAQFAGGRDLEFVFEKPELFLRFKCDIHRWMFAYVCLVDHPFFAMTDKSGNYTIKNVPPGDYEIQVLHRKAHAPKYEGIRRKIKVGEDDLSVDLFTIDIGETSPQK